MFVEYFETKSASETKDPEFLSKKAKAVRSEIAKSFNDAKTAAKDLKK